MIGPMMRTILNVGRIVTRAQGKQDPGNHIWALLTVASATDAGYGTVNRTPTFCRI